MKIFTEKFQAKTIFLIAISLPTSVAADNVVIGGTEIDVPVLAEFSNITDVGTIRQLGESVTPSMNRFLAYFANSAEFELVMAGQKDDFDNYMLIQTNRAAEELSVSRKDFKEARDSLRNTAEQGLENLRSLLEEEEKKLNADLAEEYGMTVNIADAPRVMLGIPIDEPDAIVMMVLQRTQFQTEQGVIELVQVIGTLMALVNKKILYVHNFKTWQDKTTKDKVSQELRQMVDALRAAN